MRKTQRNSDKTASMPPNNLTTQAVEAEETHRKVTKILEQYDDVVPEKLRAYLKDLPVAGTTKVTAASRIDPIVTYGKGEKRSMRSNTMRGTE